MQEHSDVLTAEEITSALLRARRAKEAEIRRQNYMLHVKNDIKSEITAEEMLEDILTLCEEDGKPLIIDDENREVIQTLTWYFSGDKRFEADGKSLQKGIWLFGGVGVGKTHLMRFFQNMQRKPFQVVDCTDVAADYRKSGEDAVAKYFTDRQITEINYWGHKTKGYCFDDLGLESDGRYFGNAVNVMERIIERRYRDRERLITHVISNLTAEQVEQRYGLRIRERCRELFNIIEFPPLAKSRRK